MKIILYRDGKPGVIVSLPGENPEAELEELLGGETEMQPITKRLTLVTRSDAEEMQLPIRYSLDKLGEEPQPVAGDAAVVAVRPDGILTDVNVQDLVMMEGRLSCMG